MKTRVAMMISVAGVLVAGSAAALVNTQVLSSNADGKPFLAGNAAQTVPATTPAASPTTPVTTPITLAVTPNSAESTAKTTGASPTQAVYDVSGSTVTLDTAGDVLTIVAVTPAPGWTVTKSEVEDGANAEVQLQSGSGEVEFHANLLFGVVTVSIESDDQTATSNSLDDNGNGGGSGGGHGSDDSGDD